MQDTDNHKITGTRILFDRDTDCLLHFRNFIICQCSGSSCRAMFPSFLQWSTFPARCRLYKNHCSCWIAGRHRILCCVLSAAPDAGLHQVWDTLPGIESESPSNLVHFCIFQVCRAYPAHFEAQRQTMMVLHAEPWRFCRRSGFFPVFFRLEQQLFGISGVYSPGKGPGQPLCIPCVPSRSMRQQAYCSARRSCFRVQHCGPRSPRLRRG